MSPWTRSPRRRVWPDRRSTSTSPTATSCCAPASRDAQPAPRGHRPTWKETPSRPPARAAHRRMLERIDDDPAFFRLALMTQGMVIQGGEAVGNELASIGLNIARLIRDLYDDGVASGSSGTSTRMRRSTWSASRSTVRCGAGRRGRSPSRRRRRPTDLRHSSCTDLGRPQLSSGGTRSASGHRTRRPPGSASGDCRDDREGLAIGHRGSQSVEEPDVLVGDEHVDEPAQAPVVVEEPVAEACVSPRGPSGPLRPRILQRPLAAPPVRVRSCVGIG